MKARRSRSVTKRAVPSAVFSAILPEKPSDTITSTSPRDNLVAFDEAVELQRQIVGVAQHARRLP